MRFASGRLIVTLGIVLALAGLLAFSLAAPTTTIGQETDVSPPGVEEPVADTGAGASPPASLPDTGNGGYLEAVGSARLLLMTMLTALGLTLTGAGMIVARKGRQARQARE